MAMILDEIITELELVRGFLDEADATPFGRMGKLLDKMALHCDRATAIAERIKYGVG